MKVVKTGWKYTLKKRGKQPIYIEYEAINGKGCIGYIGIEGVKNWENNWV